MIQEKECIILHAFPDVSKASIQLRLKIYRNEITRENYSDRDHCSIGPGVLSI